VISSELSGFGLKIVSIASILRRSGVTVLAQVDPAHGRDASAPLMWPENPCL
jgi:hypothetical protein